MLDILIQAAWLVLLKMGLIVLCAAGVRLARRRAWLKEIDSRRLPLRARRRLSSLAALALFLWLVGPTRPPGVLAAFGVAAAMSIVLLGMVAGTLLAHDSFPHCAPTESDDPPPAS